MVGRNMRNSLTKTTGLLAGVLGAALLLAAGPENPGKAFVLDNGLRIFLYEKRDLPLLHVVTAFDVGSKNETDATSGLVHLLEHCILFRGTANRSGTEVSADIRRHGAYFNGNTGQDISAFEISLPSEHAEFALRNQKDILFQLDLSQAELDEEKEVLLEEFSQMEDDPQRSAVDLVLQALFVGHPYGRSVYGRREVIRAATAADVLGFYRKYFVADNGALAIVGDFATADMEKLVREVFGPLPKTGYRPEPVPMAAPLKKSVSQRFERDVQEGYLFLGFVAPDYNHQDQYAITVLTEALGRGVNPLLPALIRSERESVQAVSMSYLAGRFGGAVIVSIKMDPKDMTAVERSAISHLKRAHNGYYSKKDFPPDTEMFAFDYLESAKNQIRFAAGEAEESGLQLAGSLARHMLLSTREKEGRYLDGIARVDSSDLRRTAARYFGKGEFAEVSIVPSKGGKK
jgi:predicted Zn-dependent peptidase